MTNKNRRDQLAAATDAELNTMLQNALADLVKVIQPPVHISALLYREDVLVASAEIIDASTPFTKNDEAASKMYFDFMNGRCVPRGVN